MANTMRPYERVASSLRNRIAAGEWRPGELIPARRALAEEYGVAPATLERAAGTLISSGILAASDRRGTFVAEHPPISSDQTGTSFTTARRGQLQATVGIIAPVLPYESAEMRMGQWPAQIVAGCEHGLAVEPGLTQRFLNLATENGITTTPAQATRRLLKEGVDALVVLCCSELVEVSRLAEAARIPLVCADYDPVTGAMPQVFIDSMAGGAVAARHLRERGYQNLTFLRPFDSVWIRARLEGAQATAGAGSPQVFPQMPDWQSCLLSSHEDQVRAGLEVGRALLIEQGTGVIAPNDAVAEGFMKAAQEQGLQAGQDYGLVGFDDCFGEGHLTSLRPPLPLLGAEAAALVVRLLRGEEAPTRIALQHRLIARYSSKTFAESHSLAINNP